MMTLADIEQVRRSAAMAPLSAATVERLLTDLQELIVERQRIASILHDLPSTVSALRDALNELHRLLASQEASAR